MNEIDIFLIIAGSVLFIGALAAFFAYKRRPTVLVDSASVAHATYGRPVRMYDSDLGSIVALSTSE